VAQLVSLAHLLSYRVKAVSTGRKENQRLIAQLEPL
jgi:hypothetical protein